MVAHAIRQTARAVQGALTLVYPHRCFLCDEPASEDFALCGDCWSETAFIGGLVCDLCGVELPGESDVREVCDDCTALPRPWSIGRSVMRYDGAGRRFILKLKHGDRPDLARAAADWLARAGEPCLGDNPILVPVPVHWSRRITRRYNQAAELARWLSRVTGQECDTQALVRTQATPMLDGKTVTERFDTIAGLIEPSRGHSFAGRHVCLVDDVMTSGATLSACANAALKGGAVTVSVLTLARVVKQP